MNEEEIKELRTKILKGLDMAFIHTPAATLFPLNNPAIRQPPEDQ